MTRRIECLCPHQYQDERYGAHIRIHNETLKHPQGGGWRCTVCKREKPK